MKRGARHHWWPQSLSRHWLNEYGHIHRVDSKGKITEARPIVLARISGGHDIVFDSPSPWEHTFEQFFDRPDGCFPQVVKWLSELVENHSHADEAQSESPFCSHECDDDTILRLFECMLSLVIRSPRFRDGAIDYLESLRGALPKPEQKRLAAANLKQSYSILTENISADGKFVVFFSDSQEFIFGDGFYHSLNVATQNLFGAKILVPLTPTISVLYVRPMQYNPVPRLMTKMADSALISLLNETVRIYSKECLFFRSEEPTLSKDFVLGEYREYGEVDPIEELIASIPGVPSRTVGSIL